MCKPTRATVAQVRERLCYDPETGVFTRRVDRGRWKAGSVFGGLSLDGYGLASFDGQRVYLHHLAHIYMTGEWPTLHTDHINGKRSDNRWSNLRQVPQAINNQNQRKARSDSTTGLKGIKPDRYGFQARVTVGGVTHYVGWSHSAEVAHQAYLTAKRRLHAGCTI